MSERVIPGPAGKRLGVSGGDIRRVGHRIEVSCCICGTVRQVRPSLVKGCTHLVCGPCGKAGRQPDVPSRPGMVLARTFDVAGFFDGYTFRTATAEERASVARAAALVRAVFIERAGKAGARWLGS